MTAEFSLPVHVTINGAAYKLPGPLALIQTHEDATNCITHVNGLSLSKIEASCPQVSCRQPDGHTFYTRVTRGTVNVEALAVVAVHAGLLAGTPCTSGSQNSADSAAAEQRCLQRAAARLTWGLAGLVFELLHCQAGLWPSLNDPVQRQTVAGAALRQLYRLSVNLALAVLRTVSQLTPARFDEMLQHGLLPSPRPKASVPVTAGDTCSTAEEACSRASTPATASQHRSEDAAAHV